MAGQPVKLAMRRVPKKNIATWHEYIYMGNSKKQVTKTPKELKGIIISRFPSRYYENSFTRRQTALKMPNDPENFQRANFLEIHSFWIKAMKQELESLEQSET